MVESWRYLSGYEPDDNVLKVEAGFKLNAIPCEGGYYMEGKLTKAMLMEKGLQSKSNNTAKKIYDYLTTPQDYDIYTMTGVKKIHREACLYIDKKEKRTYGYNIEGYSYRKVDINVLQTLYNNNADGKTIRLYCLCDAKYNGGNRSFDLISKDVSVLWGHHEKSSVSTAISRSGDLLKEGGIIRFNELNKSEFGCYRKVFKVARSAADIEYNLKNEFELENELRKPRQPSPEVLFEQQRLQNDINMGVQGIKTGTNTIEYCPDYIKNAVKLKLEE